MPISPHALSASGNAKQNCEHVAIIYTKPEELLVTLDSFVGEGLLAGQGVIVFIDTALRIALQERLLQRGFNLESARARQQFIVQDAREALAQVMVQGWPDERRFAELVYPLIQQAQGQGRSVRIFGEMANQIWGDGKSAATLQLEEFWDKVCEENRVIMRLCAYLQIHWLPAWEAVHQDIYSLHGQVIHA